ncbi:unnamed protein product, partial [Staurois parvus]
MGDTESQLRWALICGTDHCIGVTGMSLTAITDLLVEK